MNLDSLRAFQTQLKTQQVTQIKMAIKNRPWIQPVASVGLSSLRQGTWADLKLSPALTFYVF